jgi:uncharacterized protein involved in cysteine biosynthesis
MLTALARAFDQLGDPAIRRVLWISLGITLATLIALVAGASVTLAYVDLANWPWVDRIIDVLGGLVALALAILLFPAAVGVIASFFLEDVAKAVERRHYPGLGPARSQGIGEGIGTALRFLVILVSLNLLALLLVYFIPVLNLIVFYTLNGYLLGREYYELVALRRLDPVTAKALRQRSALRVFLAGVVIAVMLSVPLLNLLVPIVGTAFMVHVFQGLSRKRLQAA